MSTTAKQGIWINGKEAGAERYYPLYAPYDRALLAHVALAGRQEAEAAIDGAHAAFGAMKDMAAHERSAILYKVAEQLSGRKEEFARLVTSEAGKPIRTARAEVERTIATYRFAAEEANRLYGETVPMDAAPGGEHRLGWTWREPLGVVVAICPFNFPLNLVAHKLGPAIAAGNTVVLKPAEQTPLSALAIAVLFHEAGLPAGALQVITGNGAELGEHLLADARVKKITFTGSTLVGKELKAKAGLRKMTLELGSNAALIVEPDAPVDAIVDRCVEGAFANAGQVCISLQRIYVHQSIYRAFSDAFIARTLQLKLGDPALEETDVSVMIHEREAERIERWVQEALADGALLGCGGGRRGALYEPTVLLNVQPHMAVSCMETFAPVVSIMPYNQLQEAIDCVNASSYGLNAGIFTNDIDRAFRAARLLEAGGVMINDIPTFRSDHMPYGGVKESGYGREGIKYAVEHMTELKFVTLKTQL
ncbi:aldehyde dehydrogenase family protein [Paenibacillus sp. J5C_2022]|uniref:aldehyde dehydrogenase family protein n=1 Tax=Paenibacillus sp. J5C2022 TaxID=2977129 RepID=UPI0021D3DB26|nr:aldehyde dehydrogenase family protein [Paenibacillus sp. J5C2022]MCU6707461.1 aldehyde dehydrogenase family protein [Paenibacillus sp. J5C2022]